MPAWLDAVLAGLVVALALAWLVRQVRQPACAACPQTAARSHATPPAAQRVALAATRLATRARSPRG